MTKSVRTIFSLLLLLLTVSLVACSEDADEIDQVAEPSSTSPPTTAPAQSTVTSQVVPTETAEAVKSTATNPSNTSTVAPTPKSTTMAESIATTAPASTATQKPAPSTRTQTPIIPPTPKPFATNTPAPKPSATPTPTPTPAAPGRASRLRAVNDWVYQLEDINLASIGQTAYDLVVIDYAADGDEDSEFRKSEIRDLKNSPGGEKIVLAYMSIGEAEEYRFYWNSRWREGNPSWIVRSNPDWPGNYKVAYWESEWQRIVFDYTDRILNAGFDGVYLDIIDAYEFFEERGRTTADQDMVDFVSAIAAHAREENPGFMIFPQNGAELASRIPEFLDIVDGIGQEDIYYGYDDDDEQTPLDATRDIERELDAFKQAGKLVLTVDYAGSTDNINDAYRKSSAKGYVPYVSTRDLDRMFIYNGHEPD